MNASVRKLAMLSALYFIEGMPWGFQSKALPVYLRTHHASLTAIGFLNLLSLPWMIKVVWAPLVDRYYSPRFGRRKSWIVPMQCLLALACVAASFAARGGGLPTLLALVLCMNLFSATMDIAVDGLAVDVLDARELGTGNTAQVVGYKFGSLASGGLLVWATADLGWPALFLIMAAIVACVAVSVLFFREDRYAQRPPPPVERVADEGAGYRDPAERAEAKQTSLVEIIRKVAVASREPGTLVFFLVVATYKTGEQLLDSMFKPFLIDRGFSVAQVALWISTFGMIASLTGSSVGGVLASRTKLYRAVSIAAVLRAIPILGVFALTLTTPTRGSIIAVAMAENFFGGLLTTTMFAYMMARTNKEVGATHFTLLATIEMLGKAPVPMIAGPIADKWGYSVLFGLATLFSFAFLALLPPLRRAAIEAEK